MLKTLSAVAVASLLGAGGASAASVTFDPAAPTGALNPTATSTVGDVAENTSGSIPGIQRSPFEGGADFDDAYAYTSVGGGESATYDFGVDNNQVSFIWGSPDGYNLLTFYNDGVATGETFVYTNNGANLADPFATIRTDLAFDEVMFSSGQNAFEFAQLSVATVPLPAGGLLLLGALGGIAALRRRKAV